MVTGLEGKPIWYGAIAGLLVGAVVAFAGHKVYLQKRQDEITQKQNQLADLQKKISAGEAAEAQLQQFESRVERLEQDLEKLLRVLPDKRRVHDLIRQFRAIAEREDFTLKRFSPGDEVQQEYFNEWPIQLEVDGSYHSLARFFDRMSRFPRIVNVDNMRLRAAPIGADPTKTLSASFTAKTFVYRDVAAEEAAAEGTTP